MENNSELRFDHCELVLPKAASEAHYTVYKLTDPEGKIYIGCTGQGLKKRIRKGYNPERGYPIGLAIQKYGEDAIRKEVLCDRLTKTGAERLEKWFVDFYGSMDPKIGYNCVTGGSRKGGHMSKAAVERTREHYKAGHDSYLRVQKTKKAYYRENPEAAAIISMRMKKAKEEGKLDYFIHADNRPKPVICIERGAYYPSIRKAREQTGFQTISKVCNGHKELSGGYHWRFATKEEIKAHEDKKPSRGTGG